MACMPSYHSPKQSYSSPFERKCRLVFQFFLPFFLKINIQTNPPLITSKTYLSTSREAAISETLLKSSRVATGETVEG